MQLCTCDVMVKTVSRLAGIILEIDIQMTVGYCISFSNTMAALPTGCDSSYFVNIRSSAKTFALALVIVKTSTAPNYTTEKLKHHPLGAVKRRSSDGTSASFTLRWQFQMRTRCISQQATRNQDCRRIDLNGFSVLRLLVNIQ